MGGSRRWRKLLLLALLAAGPVVWGLLPEPALAHVEVVPFESAAGATERYGIRVPTEKPIPTVRVEVQFPASLRVLDVEAAPGWQVALQSQADGRLLGAVWDGGSIPAGQFAEFGLRAQNPDGEAELRWTAIQTYQDGTEAQWVGPASAAFPAATTRVRGRGLGGAINPLAGAAALLALAALLVSGLAWRASRR